MNLFRSLLKRVFRWDLSRHPARSLQVTGDLAPPVVVINGVAVTQEEWDERVARTKQRLAEVTEVTEQSAACHTLKLIGYWASYVEDTPWPNVRRAVRGRWRPAERELLVAYLRNGHECFGALGDSWCRFECREKYSLLGNRELTDGEWVWPQGLPHYVDRHGVMLPEEFVASASAREWKVPPVDQVGAIVPSVLLYRARPGEVSPSDQVFRRVRVEVDHSFWLEWAKGLPNFPEEQSPADVRVLERFCLTIQEPETEDFYARDLLSGQGPDLQFEYFKASVWAEVRAEFGHSEDGFGYHFPDPSIEGIPVKHRDSVVTQVLDGLRRYGLTDRVKLICSEPDPNNWQRDRDTAVWPPGDATEPGAAADRGSDPGSSGHSGSSRGPGG